MLITNNPKNSTSKQIDKIFKIVNLHWGFIPGGGASYTSLLNTISCYAPLQLKGLCLTAPAWPLDVKSLQSLDMDIIKIRGRLDLQWVVKTRKFLQTAEPELIFTLGLNGAVVAAIGGLGLGIPIVSSWHGDYFPTTLGQRLRQPFFEIGHRMVFSRLVKEIVTVSEFSRDTLIHKGIKRSQITVIHNGIPDIAIDPGIRQQIRKDLGFSENTLLVGTACRLADEKGLSWLLRACALALRSRRELRLIIWGEGPSRHSLLNLAEELGIADFVKFPGYSANLEQCLAALDIFVIASKFENFSMALLEAMRACLPILATDVGGNPEAITDGVHGLLVPFADPQAMADKILTLAGNDHLRQRLASQARQRFLNEFTAEKMVARTAAWLLDCARKHGRGAY